MTSDKARPEAWREMGPSQDGYYNSLFEWRFRFRPSVQPETWPAIREPRPSVTFDLATGRALDSATDRVCTSVLEAMQEALPSIEPLLALDPYHYCYWFWPQRWHHRRPEDWYVFPYPNGEYSITVPATPPSG